MDERKIFILYTAGITDGKISFPKHLPTFYCLSPLPFYSRLLLTVIIDRVNKLLETMLFQPGGIRQEDFIKGTCDIFEEYQWWRVDRPEFHKDQNP